MVKQYLDAAGVSQIWGAIKARFLDKNITTSQTVTGGVTFSEAIKFSKNIDIGNSTIAAGTNANAVTVTLPSKTGTLALTSDIPSVSGFAKLAGDNTWTGDNTFNKNVSGLTFTAASGLNTTIYGPDTITNSGITLTLPKKAGTFLLNTDVGVKNGVASLDGSGKVPTSQLPSYVDDIIDCYATYDVGKTGTLSNIKLYSDAAHKNLITGEGGKEYIDITEGNPGYEFRWTGTVWAQVGGSPLILGTVTGTAFDGKKGNDLADKFSDMAADMDTINTTLANKVDKKITTGTHLYSHTGSTQNEVAYGTAATANNIVQRDAAGQINLPTAEPGENQAVSKKWVESQGYGESNAYVKKVGDSMTGALDIRLEDYSGGYPIYGNSTRRGLQVTATDTFVSADPVTHSMCIWPHSLEWIEVHNASSNFSYKSYTYNFPRESGTLLVDADITAIPEATLTKILV